jgi:hypothetical protein
MGTGYLEISQLGPADAGYLSSFSDADLTNSYSVVYTSQCYAVVHMDLGFLLSQWPEGLHVASRDVLVP